MERRRKSSKTGRVDETKHEKKGRMKRSRKGGEAAEKQEGRGEGREAG